MILDIIYVIAGICLILIGADALTAGASTVARRFDVSEFVVGVIIVGLGTSMPELTVSLMGALENNPGLSIGNVVGSNIVNILLITGVTAMVYPLKVTRSLVVKEIPMVVAVSILLLGMSFFPVANGISQRILTRLDGVILLVLLALFIMYLLKQPNDMPEVEGPKESMAKAVVKIILGLAGLIIGGNRFVFGASALASMMGVSDALIGLTLAAVGTSLPELATSVVAARKGQVDMALGNIIGSNIMNILLILGVCSVITPLPFGDVSVVDLGVMTGAAVLLWLTSRYYNDLKITRIEGAIMFVCYIAYVAWLIIQQ
ncbi:MAG: calcium/sodium antiporter [Muribaculaceae bacterium]|nr:calcium/sodium antiporter [Muribaculaceae bacterium]